MAIGFGFSVSDLFLALKIVKDSVEALSQKKGSSADFAALLSEIRSLGDGLEAIEDLQRSSSLDEKQSQSLERAVCGCQDGIQVFLKSIARYQPYLRGFSTGLQSVLRKIQWALCKQEDVAKFRALLGRQASSINILLNTFQAKRTLNGCSVGLDDIVTAKQHSQTQSDRLADMLATLSVEQRQCFMIIMQQNNDLLQTVRDMQQMMVRQANIPAQVMLQQPVVLLDPFGRLAPFHLEFVTSPQCFLAVLRERFSTLGVGEAGLAKLEKQEFHIEHSKRKKPVNMTKEWERVWQPGEQYDMSMVFHRFACPPSTCSCCNEIIEEEQYQTKCQNCGLQYKRIQASSYRQTCENSRQQVTASDIGDINIPYLIQNSTGTTEPRVFRPSSDSEDESVEGYRRVQIISQPLDLLDQYYPSLLLIEDFIRFGELVKGLPTGLSAFGDDIVKLHGRAAEYIWLQQNMLPAFSSYFHISQLRHQGTRASRQLRQEVDMLVRKLCEDGDTKTLMTHIRQEYSDDQLKGYYTSVLMRMANLMALANAQEKHAKRISQEKVQWRMLDSVQR